MKKAFSQIFSVFLSATMAVSPFTSFQVNAEDSSGSASPTPSSSTGSSITVSGTYTVLDTDASSTYTPEIHLYANGKDTGEKAQVEKKQDLYLNTYAEMSVSFLKEAEKDTQGSAISYTIADTSYTADKNEAYALFAYDSQGKEVTADNQGQYPADTFFVYAKRTAVTGKISIEQGLQDPSAISIQVSSTETLSYPGTSAQAVLAMNAGDTEGTWSASGLLAMDSKTGREIEYKAVLTGLLEYNVTYDNSTTAYADETTGAYNGGLIKAVLPVQTKKMSLLGTAPSAAVTLQKDWNDNHDEHSARPAEADFSSHFYLTYSLDDGKTYQKLTAANLAQIGLTAMPERTVDSSSSYNIWTYTYAALPISTTVNGQSVTIKYGAQEDAVDSYLATDNDGSSTTVTDTYLKTFTASKTWFDYSDAYATRFKLNHDDVTAQIKAWKNCITFYSYAENLNKTDAKAVTVQSVMTADTENKVWTITVDNLPAYDENGIPVVYYMDEDLTKVNAAMDSATGDAYTSRIVNQGNFASDTSSLYAGGTLTNTLENTKHFTVTKQWVDGMDANTVSADRPDATLYLYRYADGVGSYDTASPVQGFDSASVQKMNGDVVFGYDNNVNELPKYDAEGHLYHYFARERMTGNTTDYVQHIDNQGTLDVADGCIVDFGVITNKKEGTFQPRAVKTLKAAAMQGDYYNASATFQLQRRLTGETVWTDVTDAKGNAVTTIVTDFANTSLTKLSDYAGLQEKYDETGKAYEYRSIEIAMSIGGGTASVTPYYNDDPQSEILTIPGTVGPDGTTAKFKVIRESDGSITDQLVGSTQVYIEKVWNDPTDTGKAEFVITRDDGKSTADGTLKDNDGNIVANVTLTGSTNTTIQNLPRYDADGREYVYTVKETAITNVTGYSLTGEDYSRSTAGTSEIVTQLNAKYTNTNHEPDGLFFNVEKQWLDDSDLLHRNDVVVSIYRVTTDTDGNKTLTLASDNNILNSSNLWKEKIGIAKADTSDTTGNYVVLERALKKDGTEIPVSDLKMTYTSDEFNALIGSTNEKIINGTAAMAGTVTTDEHIYHVYTYRNTASSTDKTAYYILTNQRCGTTTLSLNKTWTTPDTTGPAANFKIVRTIDGSSFEDVTTFTLDGSTNKKASYTSSALPKYDGQGRAYSYSFEETSMKDTSGTDQTITNGGADVDGDHYTVSMSSGTLTAHDAYKTASYQYDAENKKVEMIDLVVNKVWQDGGSTEQPKRPDIYFKLYRTLADDYSAASLQTMTAEQLQAVIKDTAKVSSISFTNTWDTTNNDWWWTDNLGSFPRYDTAGNKYVYFLSESMLSNADDIYGTVYCNSQDANEKPHAIASTVTSPTTEDTFSTSYKTIGDTAKVLIISDGTETSYAKTVVNYRSASRDLSGTKIWENLPAGFKTSNLPSITIDLYRSTAESTLYTGTKIASKTIDCSVTNNFKFTTQDTGFDGARFDDYGRMYYYGIKESAALNGYVKKNA